MVKFRGIEISIISQFDIRKLPEFRFVAKSEADPFTEPPPSPSASAVASCYVPIYAGSQIWFEYAIEGPHPPGAGYFFKLFLDGQLMTSWDCVEKHEYCGKTMYNIICDDKHDIRGAPHMIRQAASFNSAFDGEADPDEKTDVVEIRVYRIEHRQRIRDFDIGTGENAVGRKSTNNIRISDGGLLEPNFPHRRYKYQLLDPTDEPYATFRFYYRTLDFLKRRQIVESAPASYSRSSSATSYHDAPSNADNSSPAASDDTATPAKSSPYPTDQSLKSPASKASNACPPPSESEESLSLVTKDSIEDLPSSVPRSPKSPKSPRSPRSPKSPLRHAETFDEILENSPEALPPPPPPPSPTKMSRLSPRRLLKNDMTVKINGTEFNIERRPSRPLSPFTSGGMLRKLVPSSAPPNVTEFGPTVRDEVEKLEERVRRNDGEAPPMPVVKLTTTTRVERGGSRLIGFLAGRISKRSTQ
ncbi:uncharacterized protein AB675_11828 [Cyphellophora attinorum]|uniref:Uncharacterized protein n=1 Tax=Cyphellophora attinorum TaxID=1664694 RepID=A0A0N0NJK3_9EURO|nr:uncharacterized protein AB675_11828 [Phialophora attinorum]KPI36749.1 hypothetical protein AB675_11828 [Phialophora attinorum]